jgi:RNA polymerase sigma-70 factor (ECF subfamily)
MHMPMLARCADEDLMLLVQCGHVDAYEILYRRVATAAIELSCSVTRDRALAEEVVQEAFVTIWRSSRQYRPDRGTPRSWMLRVVRNHAIDGLRSSLRHDSRRALVDGADEWLATTPSPEDQAGLREQTHTLRRMLALLPAEQREVLALSFFADLSHGEIARALDVPLGTVKSRVRLGLDHLRSQLNGAAVALAA